MILLLAFLFSSLSILSCDSIISFNCFSSSWAASSFSLSCLYTNERVSLCELSLSFNWTWASSRSLFCVFYSLKFSWPAFFVWLRSCSNFEAFNSTYCTSSSRFAVLLFDSYSFWFSISRTLVCMAMTKRMLLSLVLSWNYCLAARSATLFSRSCLASWESLIAFARAVFKDSESFYFSCWMRSSACFSCLNWDFDSSRSFFELFSDDSASLFTFWISVSFSWTNCFLILSSFSTSDSLSALSYTMRSSLSRSSRLFLSASCCLRRSCLSFRAAWVVYSIWDCND